MYRYTSARDRPPSMQRGRNSGQVNLAKPPSFTWIAHQVSVAQIKIPRSEAVKMPNKTWPLLPYPGYYTSALDVFHQLHCLVRTNRRERRK
jgi:hypothetical protein